MVVDDALACCCFSNCKAGSVRTGSAAVCHCSPVEAGHSAFRVPVPIVLLVFAAALAGCGEPPRPTHYPVRGQVTFEGKPVSGGTVMFHHRDRAGGAAIGSDGSFSVSGAGLIPGEYYVSVTPPDPFDTPPTYRPDGVPREPREFPNFPQKYRTPLDSGLEAVVEEKENYFQFVMVKQTDDESADEAAAPETERRKSEAGELAGSEGDALEFPARSESVREPVEAGPADAADDAASRPDSQPPQ